MDDIRAKRYVRVDTLTDELFQDATFTEFEDDHYNQKLAADGSNFRWLAYAERDGDRVAA
ncbi:MAG TPA: hypothetical protein VGK24_05230 [Candidatus Angelobacter sp.]|jgi:hypothetical protein